MPNTDRSNLSPPARAAARFVGGIAAVVAVCTLPGTAAAERWLAPGDPGLRSDLQALADAAVLRAPITTWPLPWTDIIDELGEVDPVELDAWEIDAYLRVMSRAELEADSRVTVHSRVALAEHPRVIRTFDDTPREDAQIGGGLHYDGDRFTARLNATRVWDPEDGDTFRLDGSYLGARLGDWMISVGYPERWWGPGWDGSLILSTNARPIPQVSISRAATAPFRARWLQWVGPWSFTSFIGQLDDERHVDDPLLFGMRFAFKPLPGLEVGLSRTAQWCGDDRPCDAEAFGNLLLGKDNRGENVDEEDEPGNQLGGFDLRWAPFRSGLAAFYLQWIGEDSRQGGPQIGSWLRQAGVELAGRTPGARWHHRTNLEAAETICRQGGFGLSTAKPRCAYEHSIYRTGYRYRGRSLGHGMDGDGRSYSVATTFRDRDEQMWRLSLRHIEINRTGAGFNEGHTLAPTAQDFSEVMVMHDRPLAFGALRMALGYSRVEDAQGPASIRAFGAPDDDDSLFGWVEFVIR